MESERSDDYMTDAMNTARGCTEFADAADGNAVANPWGFFRHWLINPRKMGSVVPSSPALCRRLVAHTRCAENEVVVELGAGTGVISRALLESGLPPQRLFAVEIMPGLANHLRRVLPGANVIEGDARQLPKLIPAQWHGRVGTVICGIPLLLLSLADQRLCVEAIDAIAP